MTLLKISIDSIDDTDRLGAQLAECLTPGTTVSLVGTLGAGKTRLVQAVAETLGAPRDAVTSPTFVLVNEYTQGRLPVYHFDAYRLKDDDEFLQLGPDEYFEGQGLTFVEWGDRVADCLPRDAVEVRIEIGEGEQREVTIRGLSKSAAPEDRHVPNLISFPRSAWERTIPTLCVAHPDFGRAQGFRPFQTARSAPRGSGRGAAGHCVTTRSVGTR